VIPVLTHALTTGMPRAGSLVQSIDYHALLPPLLVALGALAVLVLDLLLTARRRLVTACVTIAVLVAAVIAVASLAGSTRATFCLPGTATTPGGPLCSYQVDTFTLVLQAVVAGGGLVVALLSLSTLARPARAEDRMPSGEYLFLLLCSITGALVLVAARDLVTLTVALETVSLPAFVLVGLRRRDARAAEAALKFFLVSVASTAVMLFGVSLLYGVTGSVHLSAIAAALPSGGRFAPLALAGVALTLVGFGFKVSVVPFHFWTPDTYTGAPVPIAAYLSVVSKAAGIAGLVLVVEVAFWPYQHRLATLLGVLAAVTMSFGNLVALRQRHAVRLLAWSTVAQAGYLLVPLAARFPTVVAGWFASGPVATSAVRAGQVPAGGVERAGATVTYLVIYAAMNLCAFAVVTLLSADGAVWLTDYRGLGRRRPVLGGTLAFALLCLAGMPPGLAGLFAKVAIFRAATSGGAIWLAVVTGVNVVLGLAYYLRWVAVLYAEPAGDAAGAPATPAAPARRAMVPALLATALSLAATLTFSVWPQFALNALGDTGGTTGHGSITVRVPS
jgi:NADH-quinone oxidoreductase subunit N